MMELYLKQKVFSIKGKYDVYDADENARYTVEGKVVSFHHTHYIYDNTGKQMAHIYQKVVSLGPRFCIELSYGKTYEMKAKLAFAHEVSEIKELGWEISGKFLEHDYAITKDEEVLATVHEKWVSWGDTYEIVIEDNVDEVLVLAVMLCFDVMHEEQAAAIGVAEGTAHAASNN